MDIRESMLKYQVFFFVAILLAETDGIAIARCKNPKGSAGDVKTYGCMKNTCTAITLKKGVWIDGPSM